MIRNLLWKMAILVLSLTMLCGCQQKQNAEREASKGETQEKTAILVFAVDSSSILSDFQAQYSDVEVEIVTIDPNDVQKDFEAKLQTKGAPDLIVDTGSMRGIGFWNELGACADIATYIDTDTTLNLDDYYPGVSSVGQIENQVMGLPLGLSLDYMTLREEVWDNSSLRYLDEDYTAEEVLTALEQELVYQNEAATEGGDALVDQVLADWAGDFTFLFWDSGAISESGGKIVLDENLFELICRVYEQHIQNFNYAVQKETTTMNTKTSPLENGAHYVVTAWFNSGINKGVAPQIGISYAENINREVFGENTKVLWYPIKTSNPEKKEYAARVSIWGMVGSQSERKEEAYRVLRDMMDLDLNTRNPIDGRYDVPFSVNRAKALEMLSMVEEKAADSYTITGESGETQSISRQPLSQQNRKELEDVLSSITSVYTIDRELQNQIEDIVYPYLQNGSGYYEDCYGLVLELLQREE